MTFDDKTEMIRFESFNGKINWIRISEIESIIGVNEDDSVTRVTMNTGTKIEVLGHPDNIYAMIFIR